MTRDDLLEQLAAVREERRKHEVIYNEAAINVHRHNGAEAILLQLIELAQAPATAPDDPEPHEE